MVLDNFRIEISDLILFLLMRFPCVLSVSLDKFEDIPKIMVPPLLSITSQITFRENFQNFTTCSLCKNSWKYMDNMKSFRIVKRSLRISE